MMFIGAHVIVGPGVRAEEVALRFDEAIACQSDNLDLAGLMHVLCMALLGLKISAFFPH